MNAIYTAGYGGHPVRSLIQAARSLDAFVCDIRHTPFSKAPGYSQKELRETLDTRYFHVPDLGNVNHTGDGGIKLANGPKGIAWVCQLAKHKPVILLCGCREFVGCHREHVAGMLSASGVQTSELDWPFVATLDLMCLPQVALSILQPWAWLIIAGLKDIENRSWRRDFKGSFIIHAGKGFDHDGHFSLCQNERIRRLMPRLGDFDRGGIVGMATMTGCVEDSDSEWFCGPYGFTLKHAKPLAFMPLMGARGFFNVNDQLEKMRGSKAARVAEPSLF